MATEEYTSVDCIDKIAVPINVSPTDNEGIARFTPFTFSVNVTGDFAQWFFTGVSQNKLLWDFGDGKVLSADNPSPVTYTYDYPGEYTVNLYLYDSEGRALLNSLSETITATDHSSSVNRIYNVLSTDTNPNNKPLAITVSDKSINPTQASKSKIDLEIRTTWQDYNSAGNTIYFTASGSKSKPYDPTYKYSFLLPYRSFYTFYNDEFVRTNSTTVNLNPIYGSWDSSTSTVTALTSDQDKDTNAWLAKYPGRTAKILYAKGSTSVYYYDDMPGDVNLLFALDTSKHKLPDFFINGVETDINLASLNYMESNLITIPVKVQSFPVSAETGIFFSSTGMESTPMPADKFQGDKFQVFVALSAADRGENSLAVPSLIKYYPEYFYYDTSKPNSYSTTINGISAKLTTKSDYTGGTTTPISSIDTKKYPYNSTLSSVYLSSFGYLNITPLSAGTNYLVVSARPSIDGTTLSKTVLTGVYEFEVLPSNIRDLYKYNEDFDYAETLKSYRFQNFLYEYDNLFDGVLGSIVGTLSSRPTTYGKLIFEKISNFVQNNVDVDICSIDNISKFYRLFNDEITIPTLTAPPELKRLIDILSVRVKRLTGDQEKFGDSYDTFYSGNSAYAKNIDYNNPINLSTYTVTAGTNFVAVQKFNNEPILIEPQQVPSSTVAGSTTCYLINQYNTCGYGNWGWPLDDTVQGTDLSLLYDFYPYVTNYSNEIKNSTIDYNNVHNHYLKNAPSPSIQNSTNTSVQGEDIWTEKGGIAHDLIKRKIREGLNL